MKDGQRLGKKRTIQEIAEYSRERLVNLPGEYKRFNYPHIYKVGLSARLRAERDILVEKHNKQT
jgi:nicotinate phosphoribosyltransferase